MIETIDGADATGTSLLGLIPVKNPTVTIPAAISTLADGLECVWRDDTPIVSGKTMPRAIWKNEASTPRRQRVLNISPKIFTVTTGVSFFAVWASSFGI